MLSFSRISITRQFLLVAIFGAVLTLSGIALALRQSYVMAFDAKKAEVAHLSEAAASLVRTYVKQEHDGLLKPEEAKARALAALDSMRFDGSNYFFVYTFDGVAIVNSNKSFLGVNRSQAPDGRGKVYVQEFLDLAKAGRSGFVDYYLAKPGQNSAVAKVSYIIPAPEWQWVIGTGLYVDDVTTSLLEGMVHIALYFVPLLFGFLVVVFLMRRTVAGLLTSMASGMRRLAGGDLEAPVVGLGRRDEIGAMAQALVAFRQAAVDKAPAGGGGRRAAPGCWRRERRRKGAPWTGRRWRPTAWWWRAWARRWRGCRRATCRSTWRSPSGRNTRPSARTSTPPWPSCATPWA